MDRTAEYHNIVRRILEEIAAIMPSSESIRTELICDKEHGHYHLGQVGWEQIHRVDDLLVHIDIIDGKVWLQHDGTDLRIARDLIAAGIPKEHIVLAFHQPELRKYTEFAIA